MSRFFLASASMMGWFTGCTIPLSDVGQGPLNACETASDCGAGAACADVGSRRACVSRTADLRDLILEIRPAADSPLGAEVSHLINLVDQGVDLPASQSGGQVHNIDPAVPRLAQVEGSLALSGASYCDGQVSPGAFPVKVEFRRVAPFPGLPDQSYFITSEPDGAGGQKFGIEIPTGTYDIHLVPQPTLECAYPPPAIFAPNQRIPERKTLSIAASAPRPAKGEIHPRNVAIDGWLLDVVDSLTGSVISQVQTLKQDNLTSYVPFNVEFYWSPDSPYDPILRLRSAEGQPQSTFHWDLEALLGSPNLKLSLFELDTVLRRVEGRTLDANDSAVPCALRIQSPGQAGSATYKLGLQTDADGYFAFELPPGEYSVFAQPINDSTKALASTTLKLQPEKGCFCAQAIQIPSAGTVRGNVYGPAGESMDGATVLASPSLTGPISYFERVLGLDPLLPRQVSSTVTGNEFSFNADPGEFDLSIRPPAESSYPWLVLSRLAVPADSPSIADLRTLTMPYPAVLRGTVRDALGNALGNALVSAWLPVRDETGGGVVGVIQIGQTRSGPDGAYVLPLASSVSR